MCLPLYLHESVRTCARGNSQKGIESPGAGVTVVTAQSLMKAKLGLSVTPAPTIILTTSKVYCH